MRVFHGIASISECKLGNKIKIGKISTVNLRGKEIKLPKQFYDLIINKYNEWADAYHTWLFHCPDPPIDRVGNQMFTVALNDDYMVMTLQHPSDTPSKKRGWAISVGRLRRCIKGKSYINKQGRHPKWLIFRNDTAKR